MADSTDHGASVLALRAFLTARFIEDRQRASQVLSERAAGGDAPTTAGQEDADRALLASDSREQIEAIATRLAGAPETHEAGMQILTLLALPYRDHADWQESWQV